MHLIDLSTGDWAASNDDGGAGLASRIVFTNPHAIGRDYMLVVHAYSTSSQGTAHLEINGEDNGEIAVGGARLWVSHGQACDYGTALRPGGATDTYLIGLDCAQRARSHSDDGGVGLASRLTDRTDICSVIVGAYSTLTEGTTRLYLNDHWTDSDGDGLGAGLELALDLCDSPGQSPWCQNSVFNTVDTDHDGLDDGWEVFGIEDALNPQYLPAWGASPVRKDIFVEVDYTDQWDTTGWNGTNPYAHGNTTYSAADHATAVQALFDPAPADAILNPDGSDGVAIHLDIGVDAVDSAHVTLDHANYQGQWSGCAVLPTTDQPRFHCYAPATDRWTDLTGSVMAEARPTIDRKVGLTFHLNRLSTGALESASRMDGRFWFVYSRAAIDHKPGVMFSQDMGVPTYMQPHNRIFLEKHWGDFGGHWSKLQPAVGVALYSDDRLTALKGVYLVSSKSKAKLNFLPFADGTFRADMRDGNDFQVMERNICRRLRGAAYCGDADETAWPY